MPHFSYRAKKGPTELVDGQLEAGSVEEAVEKLDEMGLLAVKLDEINEKQPGARSPEPEESRSQTAEKKKEKQPGARSPEPGGMVGITFFSRVKSSEITFFGRQMASLLKSGVPILRALWIISEQTQNPKFKHFLTITQQEINNGRAFSSVLADYPKYFSPLYVAMVRMGEDSGNLQEAMIRISDYRQKQEEIVSRVRTAMAYPALMGLTGVGTIIFMLAFVIPKLTALFSNLGTHLPAPTRLLMSISSVFQKPELWAVLGALMFLLVVLLRWRAKDAAWFWSVASLRIPIIKSFVMKSDIARFSRTFELLIQSGLPILKAIESSVPVLNNLVYRQQLIKAQEELTGGGSLGRSLKQCGVFPLFMTNLISVAEESGMLDEAMKEIAQYYERETDEQIKVLTSLMEPLMILVMGAIVGFIVMAMMLPMFELNMIIK